MSDAEVEYWRELAEQYRRELHALRERVLRYLESPTDNIAALLSTARQDDVDRIEPELKSTDVKTMLDDLWNRVAADE